jgi:hypothetical protein
MLMMTREEQDWVLELFTNPPPGSKIEAARKYGVDLTLLAANLALTPEERVQAMESALRLIEDAREAIQQTRQ